jgi:hypothetical protein
MAQREDNRRKPARTSLRPPRNNEKVPPLRWNNTVPREAQVTVPLRYGSRGLVFAYEVHQKDFPVSETFEVYYSQCECCHRGLIHGGEGHDDDLDSQRMPLKRRNTEVDAAWSRVEGI